MRVESLQRLWTCCASIGLLLGKVHMVCADMSSTPAEQRLLQYVGTPHHFQAAVQAGVHHIILKNHIDLRHISQTISNGMFSNGTLIIEGTQSIRVCTPHPLPGETGSLNHNILDFCIYFSAFILGKLFDRAVPCPHLHSWLREFDRICKP